MKKSVKMVLATSAVAVAGGLFFVGSGYADGGFGPGHGMMGRHGMMGAMGGFGEMHQEMLGKVDTSGDGKISQEEIDAAVSARFAEFDADKNGSLSLDEFQALWSDLTKPIAVRAFQFLDPNGNAAVSKEEADQMFGHMAERFDHDDDGMLSPEDRGHHRRFGWGRGDGPRDGSGPRWGQGDGPGSMMGPGNGPRDGSGPRGRWMWQPDTEENE